MKVYILFMRYTETHYHPDSDQWSDCTDIVGVYNTMELAETAKTNKADEINEIKSKKTSQYQFGPPSRIRETLHIETHDVLT